MVSTLVIECAALVSIFKLVIEQDLLLALCSSLFETETLEKVKFVMLFRMRYPMRTRWKLLVLDPRNTRETKPANLYQRFAGIHVSS